MKFGKITLAALVLSVLGLAVFTMSAQAGWGRGPGNCDGPGYAGGPRGGFGGGGQLSDEEIAIVQKERNAFFESTRDLRERRYQKSLELRAEMAKQNPDAAKAAALQKEVSTLDGELDAKRIDQQLKMKKEYPQIYGKGFGRMGMGYGGGAGMGPGGGGMGRGMGPGYGRGGAGGGAPCCQ